MKLILDWSDRTKQIKSGERSLAFKWRMGAPPTSLNTRIEMVVGNNIHHKWKRELLSKMRYVKFMRNVPCNVRVDGKEFQMHGTRNEETFVSNLANLILRTRKDYKNRFGTVSKETVLKSLK